MVTINDVDRYRVAVDESIGEYRSIVTMQDVDGGLTDKMVALQEAIKIRLNSIYAAFDVAEKMVLRYTRIEDSEGAERALTDLYRTCNRQVLVAEELKDKFWAACYE